MKRGARMRYTRVRWLSEEMKGGARMGEAKQRGHGERLRKGVPK
jgi:hypothetical protein